MGFDFRKLSPLYVLWLLISQLWLDLQQTKAELMEWNPFNEFKREANVARKCATQISFRLVMRTSRITGEVVH